MMVSSDPAREKGSILIISLIVLTCSGILITGLAPLASSQIQYTNFHKNRIQARYIAEAGARVVIKEVESYIENMGEDLSQLENCTTNGLERTGYIDGAQKIVYRYKYYPLTNPERVRIEVNAKSGNLGSPVTVMADVYLDAQAIPKSVTKTNVSKYILSANNDPMKNLFSTDPEYNGAIMKTKGWFQKELVANPKAQWVVDEEADPPYATPPNDTSHTYNQRIVFDNILKRETELSYRFEFQKDPSQGGGPQIFYGIEDGMTAKNFSAYNVQFSRKSGEFAVTKMIADNSDPNKIKSNVYNDKDPYLLKFPYKSARVKINGTWRKVNNYSEDFQSYTGNDLYNKNHGFALQPNGTGLSTQGISYSDPNYASKFDINIDRLATDPLGNPIGRCSITWEGLEAVLKHYYQTLINQGKQTLPDGIHPIPDPNSFSLSQENNGITMTVKTTDVTLDKVYTGDLAMDCDTGNVDWIPTGILYNQTLLRHQIFIDGCPILDFIDFNKYYNVTSVKSNRYDIENARLFFKCNDPRADIKLGDTHRRSGFGFQYVKNTKKAPMKFYNVYSNDTVAVAASGNVLWLQ
ncbi:MAG TPA: hypothetical protein VIM29_11215 [Bacillota bacterium]